MCKWYCRAECLVEGTGRMLKLSPQVSPGLDQSGSAQKGRDGFTVFNTAYSSFWTSHPPGRRRRGVLTYRLCVGQNTPWQEYSGSWINTIYYNYDYQSQLPYNNWFRREVSSNAKGFKLTSHIHYYLKKNEYIVLVYHQFYFIAHTLDRNISLMWFCCCFLAQAFKIKIFEREFALLLFTLKHSLCLLLSLQTGALLTVFWEALPRCRDPQLSLRRSSGSLVEESGEVLRNLEWVGTPQENQESVNLNLWGLPETEPLTKGMGWAWAHTYEAEVQLDLYVGLTTGVRPYSNSVACL